LKENQQIKHFIKQQSGENEVLKKEILNLCDSINQLKLSLRGNSIGDIILEKSQLIESIDSISNDVKGCLLRLILIQKKIKITLNF
jgi:hypothetical protein